LANSLGFRCLDCEFAKRDVTSHECPKCSAFLAMEDHLHGPLQTTHSKTANAQQYSRYIRKRPDTTVDPSEDHTWCFTDGATRGAYACVVITERGIREYTKRVHRDSLAKRNVTAEMRAVAVALLRCRPHQRVYVVSDYLGTGCWLHGKWRIKNSDALKILRLMSVLIERRGLEVVFIHHKGHQFDTSDFTRYNSRADELCEIAIRDQEP